MGRLRLGALIVVAVALASPAVGAAQEAVPGGGTTEGTAISFGARLGQRNANNTASCGSFFTPGFPPSDFASCTIISQNFTTGEGTTPPAGRGTITSVRIKVGPTTGPMRLTIMRAFRNAFDNSDYRCCTAVRTTGTFTPTRNATTRITTNLPVTQSRVPNSSGFYVDDKLALTMLTGNTPIPASLDGNASAFYSIWFPRALINVPRPGPFSGATATLTLRAVWQPT